MPTELKDALESAALSSKRSLTAEIVARLQQTFDADVTDVDAEVARIRAERDRQEQTLKEGVALAFSQLYEKTEEILARRLKEMGISQPAPSPPAVAKPGKKRAEPPTT